MSFVNGLDPRQGMGTLGLPGIFVGQSKSMGLKNHLDIPYVIDLMPKSSLDFGLLDLWALKQRTDSPLLSLAVDNAQIIESDADYYTYELPSAADATTRLVSGGLDKDRIGEDGELIPFVVTRRDFSPGAVFKFDVLSPFSFTVEDRPIEELGEHYKFWAKLNTNAQVPYISKSEFQPQRQLIKIADIRGIDFSSYKSVWSVSGVPSKAKFKNYLTNATLNQSYRVTSGAVEYLQGNHRITDNIRQMEETVLQFYQVRGIADNKYINLTNQKSYEQYYDKVMTERNAGNGEMIMTNLLDSIAVQLLVQQNNTQMIWGSEVSILRDGYDTTRMVPGVWFQLDLAGYKRSFTIATFSLSTITDAIKDYEFGKVPLRPSISNNVYIIKTGRGGSELVYQAFLKGGFNINAQIMNSDHGFITGDANNLAYKAPRFTSYQIPNIGILKVEWEPGFDPVSADEFTNPILASGYRLSSYTMLIEDYDTSRDNIAIIRRQNAGKVKMKVQAGDETHPLFRYGTSISGKNIEYHNASDDLSGYQVDFKTKAYTAIVKDPTKLLKLVPKNPRTGLASL